MHHCTDRIAHSTAFVTPVVPIYWNVVLLITIKLVVAKYLNSLILLIVVLCGLFACLKI